jgi:hypothetical protein
MQIRLPGIRRKESTYELASTTRSSRSSDTPDVVTKTAESSLI